MVDFLAFLLLAFLTYRGSKRGTASMAWAVGALLAGYGAAFLFYRPIGGILKAVFHMPPLFAYAAGGALVMILVMGGVRGHANRLHRDRKERIAAGWEPPQMEQVGGAAFGLVLGLGLLVFLGWAVSALGGVTGKVETHGSLVAKASTGVVETVVRVSAQRASGDAFLASSMALLVADPAGGIEVVQQLMNDERIWEIAADSTLLMAVVDGKPEVLARDLRVRALAADPGFLASARRIGLLADGDGPIHVDELAERVVEHVGPMIRTVEILSQDPEVLAAVKSPEVAEALNSGKLLALATEEKLQALFSRVLKELRAQY
jgi:hypothetical protein